MKYIYDLAKSDKKIKVFISYSWDDEDHKAKVKEFADAFAQFDDIDCVIDQYVPGGHPEMGWPRWMDIQVDSADKVLIVCTDRYKQLVSNPEKFLSSGAGVAFEFEKVLVKLYIEKSSNKKFKAICFGKNFNSIPERLISYGVLDFPDLNSKNSLEKIVYFLRDQQPLKIFPDLNKKDDEADYQAIPFFGREIEVQSILDFLSGEGQYKQQHRLTVTGVGGIGKSALCGYVLDQWKKFNPNKIVVATDLSLYEEMDDPFLYSLKIALGIYQDLEGGKLEIKIIERLHELNPSVLYINNLESVNNKRNQQTSAKSFLKRTISSFPLLRILASSREKYLLEKQSQPIELTRLTKKNSIELFNFHWVGEELSDEQIADFVSNEGDATNLNHLDGHPLSIELVAKLGLEYSFSDLVERWRNIGTALVRLPGQIDIESNLQVSLKLLETQINEKDESLCQWWLIFALIPQGVTRGLAGFLGCHDEKFDMLRNFSILTYVNQDPLNRAFRMLVPIANYALERGKVDGSGFYARCAIDLILQKMTVSAQSIPDIVETKEDREKWSIFQSLAPSIIGILKYKNDAFSNDLMLNLLDASISKFYVIDFYNEKILETIRDYLDEIKADPIYLARCYRYLAGLNRNKGQPVLARELFVRAINLHPDNIQAGAILRELAQLDMRYEPELAFVSFKKIKFLYKALLKLEISISEREYLNVELGNVYRDVGKLHLMLYKKDREKRFSIGLSYLELSKRLLSQVESAKQYLIYTLIDIGRANFHYRKYDYSEICFIQALSICNSYQVKGKSNVLKAQGDLYLLQNKFQLARESYEKARLGFVADKDLLGQAHTLFSFGKAIFEDERQDYVKGIQYFEEALSIYKNESLTGKVVEVLWFLIAALNEMKEKNRVIKYLIELEQIDALAAKSLKGLL